jgi:sterol 3beta-glucosyltransferase
LVDVIFEAVKNAGVRAIVSAGWAGLGKGRENDNPDIFILDSKFPLLPL